jgi:uncharacterized protein
MSAAKRRNPLSRTLKENVPRANPALQNDDGLREVALEKKMRYRMKTQTWLAPALIVLSAGLLVAQQTAPADLPATKADVLKMFDVMHLHDQMQEIMAQMMQQMNAMNREQLKKRHPDISEEELAQIDKDSEEILKGYPVDGLIEDMVPVYQKHLNKADVDAMTAFYASATGQKILREMPAMTAEGMQAAYPRIQKNLDEIFKRLDEKAEEHEKPAAPRTAPEKK